jgi:hypothetical protein
MAYGDGRPDAEQGAIPTRVRVYSLEGEPLGETTVDLTPGKQDDTIAVRVDGLSSILTILERGVHIPERGFFRLQGATDDPVSIGGDVLLTRADRQRYKTPIYNLTTGQPLPDVKGEGNLALNFDNSAFHSLFPDAELAIVRIPKLPDRASPEEIAEHQARMRELVEQGIEIDGQRYDLVLATGARKHGNFLFAHTPYWKKIAPTFEKIMAYGGIMLTSCREPPRQFKHLRVLIVEEDGEYGTDDCKAKMADWLFEEFGQQGHRFRAGRFRLLAEWEDESGMVVVGKGTIKRMDHQDVDELKLR